jgi:hypothetical protein
VGNFWAGATAQAHQATVSDGTLNARAHESRRVIASNGLVKKTDRDNLTDIKFSALPGTQNK